MQSITRLSKKRILITSLLFLMIPGVAHLINPLILQYDISLMFSLNIFASLMIIYDWNLFGIHYNRAKHQLLDTLLYTLLGFVLFTIWTYVALNFLSCKIIMPPTASLRSYGYARLAMLIAYSFMEAAAISIEFKVLTDRIHIVGHELEVILFTGLACGILFTFAFLPSKNILTILTTLLYNCVMMTIISYLYNQSGNFISGLLGLALSNLAVMCFFLAIA